MGLKDARRLGLVEAAICGRASNTEGAKALGISRRQFIRLKARVRKDGAKGLLHGNRGRSSPCRLPKKTREKIMKMLQEEPVRLNDCHLADLLVEEGLGVSSESVRRIRLSIGIRAKRPRHNPLHRRRREREARMGALVQVDGSPYHWLGEDLPSFSLLGAIDDATGKVLALTFRPEEDLHGYAIVFRQVFTQYGLPLAFYGDQTSILVRNDPHWTVQEQLDGRQGPTQMGRILEELGIRYIAARSPQAKGRVERLWNTMQDRLAAELQRKRIRTIEAALAYLPGFIERYNRRFEKAARETPAAWRKSPQGLDLILCCRYARVVARDNTISIHGRCLDIPKGPHQRSWHSCKVEVRELLDGRLRVVYQGRTLAEQPAPPGPFTLLSRSSKRKGREDLSAKDAQGSPRIEETMRPKVRASRKSKDVPARGKLPADHSWRKYRPPTPCPE